MLRRLGLQTLTWEWQWLALVAAVPNRVNRFEWRDALQLVRTGVHAATITRQRRPLRRYLRDIRAEPRAL